MVVLNSVKEKTKHDPRHTIMFTVNTIQTLFYFSSGGQSGSGGRPEPELPELAGKRSFRANRLGPYFSAPTSTAR